MKVDSRKIDIAQNLLKSIIRKLWDRVDLIDDDIHVEFSITCYKNGRENGFTIRRLGKDGDTKTSVTFAECRNSDRIVVYHNISIAADGPSDDDFNAAEYFSVEDECIRNCFFHLIKRAE